MSYKTKLPGISTEPNWINKVVGAGYLLIAFLLALMVLGLMVGPAPADDPATVDAEPVTTTTTTTTTPQTPQAQPTPTHTPAPTTAPATAVTKEMMTAVIADHGVHVGNVAVSDDHNYAAMDHYTTQTTTNGLAGEMGTIGGAWAGYVKDNPNAPDKLIVYVVPEGTNTPVGHYIVHTDDARAYANGEMSGEVWAQRIINTIVNY